MAVGRIPYVGAGGSQVQHSHFCPLRKESLCGAPHPTVLPCPMGTKGYAKNKSESEAC